MIHHLTPDFILANANEGNDHGQFLGVALFADISGFTPLTRALMTHGNEGAETIATVLSAVFDPLVEIVFAHGGFIAGFAGDAFKAIFPVADDARGDANDRAVRAAWQICAHMRDNHTHETRFGPFDFDVTLCVADGDVTWEILSDRQQDEITGDPSPTQQMACMIEGSALARCLALDPYAETGQVVLSLELATQLDPSHVETEPVEHFARLVTVKSNVLEKHPHRLDGNVGIDPPFVPQARRFHPDTLLNLKTQGEFRRVVTLFFDLQTLPTPAQRPAFEADFFRLLRQYDGYLCRVGRAGDWGSAATFLLFWGAPSGHENDNQRALDFALKLLDAGPTPARAGITTSIAYAGFVGGARHEEYTCYGNYVNLAARQTKAAGWGEIWLDRETSRQAEGAFGTKALGVQQFKGFRQPRLVFQLRGRRQAAKARFYRQELVGRSEELVQLARACDPIFSGRFGGIVTVVGEAGMGKSRLVHEFQQQLAAETAMTGRAVSWFLCQTDEILRQPLNPIRYFLRHYFAQLDASDEVERRRRFEIKFDGLIAITADETLRTELQRVHSFLGALVDLHWPESLYEQLAPELRFENTVEALKSFIKAESLRQPLILQVEDIHWIDQETLTSLARLMRNVADYPFMVVATARPAATGTLDTRLVDAVPDETPTTVVKLGALANDQLGAMAADLLNGPPAASLAAMLEARADGNPFFVEQILLYLREQNLLVREDDGWSMRTDGGVDRAASQVVLSGDVRAVLTARLDRLDSQVREVVQTASVLGREFDEHVLAHMLQQDQRLPDQLASASDAAIWSAIEQTRYMFRHALLRDAAYDMQLRSSLRGLHAKAGAAIEMVQAENLPPFYADLVHHYHESEQRAPEREYAELAGGYAADQYANEDALRFLDRALALTDESDIESRFRLLLGHEEVANTSGARNIQATDVDQLLALESGLNQAQVATILLRQAHLYRVTNEYSDALPVTKRALEIASQAHEPALKCECHICWGKIALRRNEYAESEAHFQIGLHFAEELGLLSQVADIEYHLGMGHFYRSEYQRAMERLNNATTQFKSIQDSKGQIQCLHMFGLIYKHLDQHAKALAYYTKGLSLGNAIGWKHSEAHFVGALGNQYFEFGDYELAVEYHERSITICRDLGDQEGEAISLDTLGLVAFARNDVNSALDRYHKALRIQQEINDKHGIGYTKTHLGYALLATGKTIEAEELFVSATELRHEIGENITSIDSQLGLAAALLERALTADALIIAEQVEMHLSQSGTDGLEFPVLAYFICYQAFAAASELDKSYAKRALRMLETGRDLLHQRAEAIDDPKLRAKFMTNVPANRQLMAEWRANRLQKRP